MKLTEQILEIAREKGLKVAVAESCTGGLLASTMTDIPGVSHMFECGIVTYSNEAKRELLGVKQKTLDAFGAVSEEVAREMAEGAVRRSEADIAVSTTGIAGPGNEGTDKPEGRVCFAVACKGRAVTAETVEFGPLGRDAVRHAAVEHALRLMRSAAADW